MVPSAYRLPARAPRRDVFGVLRTKFHSSGQGGLRIARRFLAGLVHAVRLARRVRRLLLVSPLRLLLISLSGLLLISGLRLRPLLKFGLRLRPLLISSLRRLLRLISALRWRLPWSGLHRPVGLRWVVPGTGRLGHAFSLARNLRVLASFAGPHPGLEAPHGRPYRLVRSEERRVGKECR